jgi:hypothetical protein
MWKGKTALRLLFSAHKRITGSINQLYASRSGCSGNRVRFLISALASSSNESPALLTGSDASRSGCCGKDPRV